MILPGMPATGAALRILFVDDEPNVLAGLRRGMHGMRAEWDMTFASSGIEALNMMASATPDVVISDMRMPGMDGKGLLLEVRRLYPKVVRFILSGYADSSSIMQVAGVAHQYLAKPCEVETLKAALKRAFSLRRLLTDDNLLRSIGRIDVLPSLPSIYQEVVACVQGIDPSIGEVARIISRDVAMTTMVLKLANSAFFGAKQSFRTADRAVSFLGLTTIAGLVLAHSVFNGFSSADKHGLNLQQLWTHSLQTAANARSMAQAEKWSVERVEEAYLAGLLHDIGKIVLATGADLSDDRPSAAGGTEAEGTGRWDAHHSAVGAYLLGLWGFSDAIVEAIAFHHAPGQAGEFGLVGLLYVADQLALNTTAGMIGQRVAQNEECYLESLGLSGRFPVWQAACNRS